MFVSRERAGRAWLRPSAAFIAACLWLGVPCAQENDIDLSDWDWSAASDDTVQDQPATSAEVAQTKKPPAPQVARPDMTVQPHAVVELFAGLPPFLVVPSVKDKDMHPCGNCHQWAKSDPTPRTLKQPHDNFEPRHGLHGKGQFWCFTCHHLEGPGGLRTLEGQKVGFDEAYVVCSQCHTEQARDWAYGSHGKRIGDWRGERRILNCTACHYQHRPAWKPRDAKAGPKIRQGLERPTHWVPVEQRGQPHLSPERLWEDRPGDSKHD